MRKPDKGILILKNIKILCFKINSKTNNKVILFKNRRKALIILKV
jgi:hypothetical protein